MMPQLIRFPAKPDTADFGKLSVGVIVFLLLLIYPPPPLMTSILIDHSNWLTPLSLLLFFAFLLNRNENGWETVQLVLVFALFAIPLIYKWQFAQHDGIIIGGLLPWSDADGYNWQAQRLANGALLSEFGARRPLFSGFLAVLFRLTGDFMITVSILTLMNMIAVFFAVRIVKRLYGATAAAFFLIISFEFYIRFSGTTLTEQLGFATGNLALFFLLIGAHARSLWRALFGLALLTLALNARAGAFFILPMLIVWMAFAFRQRTTFWRSGGFAIVVVVAVFLLNLVLVRVIAEPQGAAFSNYSYTLYGLASGNKGWTQVIRDHPEVTEQEIMPLAIQKIRSEPSLLLQGMFGSFADYFRPIGGAFTFIYQGPIQLQISLMLWGLVVSGLAYSVSKWKEGLQGLTLASFLGVISSIPLLPPIDSDGMRVYAATIPFSAVWVATGVSALFTLGRKLIIKRGGNETETEKETGSYFQKPALFFSLLLISLATIAPLLLKTFVHVPNAPHSASRPTCEPGWESLNGIKFKNTSIFIIQNEAAAESYAPFIRISDFRQAVTRAPFYPFLDEELLNLKAGDQISSGLNLLHGIPGNNLWMVSKFPVGEGEFHLCGRATDNKQLQSYNFYNLERMTVPSSTLTVSQENPTITRLFRLLYGVLLGIVLFLLVMRLIGFTNHSPVEFLYTAGIVILILPGLFVSLYVNGKLLPVLTPAQVRIPLQMQRAEPQEGNLYIFRLGIDWMSQADLGESPAIVYENDIPLQWPNSLHQEIRELGNGRYSVWEGKLYFSSSDNTDPRTNGRVYEIEWPRPIPLAWQRLSFLISILGIALIFLGKRLTHMWTGKPEKSLETDRANAQE